MLRHSRLRSTALLTVGAALLVACGGDDETDRSADDQAADTSSSATMTSDAAPDAASDPAPDAAGDGAAEIEVGEGDTVRDVLTDAMGDQGADLDAAISAIPAQSRFEAVAGQLDPEPSVEIDGGDIRLVFDGGTVADATFACIVGGSFVEPGETLTVVYPDGEQAC